MPRRALGDAPDRILLRWHSLSVRMTMICRFINDARPSVSFEISLAFSLPQFTACAALAAARLHFTLITALSYAAFRFAAAL